MAPYRICSCHERRYREIWIRYHAQRTKKTKFMKSSSLRTFKVKFLTRNVISGSVITSTYSLYEPQCLPYSAPMQILVDPVWSSILSYVPLILSMMLYFLVSKPNSKKETQNLPKLHSSYQGKWSMD